MTSKSVLSTKFQKQVDNKPRVYAVIFEALLKMNVAESGFYYVK